MHRFVLFLGLVWGAVLPHAAMAQAAQAYFGGALKVYALKYDGLKFRVFDLMPATGGLKVCYLGSAAGERVDRYLKQNRMTPVCYFAAGFAQDWDTHLPPQGLCGEQGQVINRNFEATMDALAYINSYGQLQVADWNREGVVSNYKMAASSDRSSFLAQASRNQLSYFQTQLLYSHRSGYLTGPETYGKKASRRFQAICLDATGKRHELIMELVEAEYLNLAATKAVAALQAGGFTPQYLLNHDTGSRNIMRVFDDRGNTLHAAPMPTSDASQLLIYYK